MPITPSKYQQDIYDFVQNGTGNAVINAVAGSGKTTTIVKAVDLIPADQTVAFLAFGKAIADEIRTRVPAHIDVSTIHSKGAKAVWAMQRSKLDQKKIYNIVNRLKDSWFNDQPEIINGEYLARVRKLVDLGRLELAHTTEDVHALANKHGIETINGEIAKSFIVRRLAEMDTDSHDFVDMLYIPASTPGAPMPTFDWIFIDECQDLNKAQQVLFRKMMKPTTRFIAVGDPRQAIFGFAGADEESFTNLTLMPDTIELPLSMNYRCCTEVIDLVHELLPEINIEAHPGAPKGVRNDNDKFRNIADGDMVLCRNTAPLVKMCLQFIKDHKKAYVKGGDMGKQLANLVVSSKAVTLRDFEGWMAKQLAVIYTRIEKSYPLMSHSEITEESAYAQMAEKKYILETIIDSADLRTPDQLITWINELFADNKAGICFSSIHRSKGLENERIFIIERDLMPSRFAKTAGQLKQESNLLYVAITRAKGYIGFVEDWHFKSK